MLLLEQLLQAFQASAMPPSHLIAFKDKAYQQQANTCRNSSVQTHLVQENKHLKGRYASRPACGRKAERCPYHETGQTERNDNGLPREGGQVVGNLEVAAVVGQQH